MNLWESIILGIIQGLTEFLPVSSSGHLELAKKLVGDDSLPAESMAFTVVVHAATALSTIVVYRKDIVEIVSGIFRQNGKEERAFAWKIVLSMIPAATIGVLFNDEIEALFSRQILLVGAMLLVTGLLLFLADRARQTGKQVSTFDSIIIGVAQAIAILPGISRSGATISTSVLLGIDKEKAARFSFLMVVPLILGKMAKDLMEGGVFHNASVTNLSAAFFAAFITGILACSWMISIVKRSQLKWFAYYCFAIGIIAIFLTLI